MGFIDDMEKVGQAAKQALRSYEANRKQKPILALKCPCGLYREWDCTADTPEVVAREIKAHIVECEHARRAFG